MVTVLCLKPLDIGHYFLALNSGILLSFAQLWKNQEKNIKNALLCVHIQFQLVLNNVCDMKTKKERKKEVTKTQEIEK